jgi:hypothetical protein
MIRSTSTDDVKAFHIKQPRFASGGRLLGVLQLGRKKSHQAYVKKRAQPFQSRSVRKDKNPSDRLLTDELVELYNKPIKDNP